MWGGGWEGGGGAAHRDQAGLLLQGHHFFRALEAVRQRDFDLHVLASLQAGQGLLGVHLRRGAENDGVDLLHRQAVGEVGGDVTDAVLVGDLLGLFKVAADERDHFDTVDVLDAVEVLDAESAGAGESYFDGHGVFSE